MVLHCGRSKLALGLLRRRSKRRRKCLVDEPRDYKPDDTKPADHSSSEPNNTAHHVELDSQSHHRTVHHLGAHHMLAQLRNRGKRRRHLPPQRPLPLVQCQSGAPGRPVLRIHRLQGPPDSVRLADRLDLSLRRQELPLLQPGPRRRHLYG